MKKSFEILLHISLLCALRIYLTVFDIDLLTQFGAFSVRYLFNMINYPPAKIAFFELVS